MDEFWDVYDKNRILQNKIIRRGDVFKEDEYYVSCEAWIKNSKGKLLVTLRALNKKAGGLWEFVGGGVLAGETTAQGVIREIKEEIGLNVGKYELTYLGEYQQRNYFMDIYLVNKDIEVSDLVLDANETTSAKWVTQTELQQIIDDGQFVNHVAKRYNLFKHLL